MWPNPQETFAEEILNGKLQFLWSDTPIPKNEVSQQQDVANLHPSE